MNGQTKAESPEYTVPAVVKAFALLEALKKGGPDLSTAELSRTTGLNQSTVLKLMSTLVSVGAASRSEKTRRYSLGTALADYGRAALNQLDVRRLARPLLKELAEKSGETAVLGVVQGNKILLADKKEPLLEIRVSPFVGLQVSGSATAHGKALLAWSDPQKTEELIAGEGLVRHTKTSIVDRNALIDHLALTRTRGYATDRDEYQEGVSGVAAPVFNPSGVVVATLSIVGPSFRVDDKKLREFGELSLACAGRLTALLGSKGTRE